MSDSGRVIGDCRHNQPPDWCPHCLQAEVERLQVQRNRLLHQMRQASNSLREVAADVAAGGSGVDRIRTIADILWRDD